VLKGKGNSYFNSKNRVFTCMGIKDIQRLEKIRELNSENPNWVNHDLYRFLFKDTMYAIAYETLKSNAGNMTAGSDGSTIDGFSAGSITKLINSMKDESFQFAPARRVEIPKANGKKRQLGIAPPRDKIVQEIIKIILEAIYEPTFSDKSHGFRSGRGCHTALKAFRLNWSGVNWIIEGDIKGFFDNISHNILIEKLRERIADERFLNLIRKALNAGYLEYGRLKNTIIGTPQGSVVSPILANIYLDGFDKFVENVISETEVGTIKKIHPEKNRLSRKYLKLHKKAAATEDLVEKAGLTAQAAIAKKESALAPMILNDGSYVRMKYIRYADDWIIGINGPRVLDEDIRQKCADYLSDVLDLELSFEKTHIRHAKTETAKFLGTDLRIGNTGEGKKANFTSKNGIKYQKSVTGWTPYMKAPIGNLVRNLANKGFCDLDGNPLSKASWSLLDDIQIVDLFGSIWRGLHNYYSFVDNRSNMNRIQFILLHSAAKTLADKHRSSVRKMFKKHGKWLEIKVYNSESKVIRTLNFPYEKSLNRNPKDFKVNNDLANGGGKMNFYIRLRTRSKLFSPCCICGETENIEMHHVKHIRKIGEKVKGFTLVMARLNRKQIPVCRECHNKIHSGKYDGLKLNQFILPNVARA